MTPKLVPAVQLIEDFSLYPRNTLDDVHVGDLVRAIQAGATLPPIIAQRGSGRIVDGFHRRRAWIKVRGEDVEVPVEFRDYADDAALFLAAVTANAEHGRKLDRDDQVRIILRSRELKVEDRVIAVSLHVPEERVRVLSMRVIRDDEGTEIPSKRGLEHLAGQELTPAQIDTVNSVRSAEAGRLALELTRLLRDGLVNVSHPPVLRRLLALQQTLGDTLKQLGAVA